MKEKKRGKVKYTSFCERKGDTYTCFCCYSCLKKKQRKSKPEINENDCQWGQVAGCGMGS